MCYAIRVLKRKDAEPDLHLDTCHLWILWICACMLDAKQCLTEAQSTFYILGDLPSAIRKASLVLGIKCC